MIKRIILNIWPFLLALLILALIIGAGYRPDLIEKYYTDGFYPLVASIFSFFSRIIPFSLWELFWICSIMFLIISFSFVLFRKYKFKKFILKLFQVLALLYSFFYISWGFNYFRPGIEERSGWSLQSPDEKIFREVFDTIIANTNKSYSVLAVSDYRIYDSLIEKSFMKNTQSLGIDYPNGYRVPKKMILSDLFAKSGVSGYFGPFFNEIHLNTFLLPAEYPFVLAHEKAHQFGITEEAEANLAAYIVCSSSADKRIQYSANLQLLSYFLSDAHRLPDRNLFVNRIDSLVKEDIINQRKHWRSLENKTFDKVQTAANNVYLKTNKIKDGVKNYNRVVSLVLLWYMDRKNQEEN